MNRQHRARANAWRSRQTLLQRLAASRREMNWLASLAEEPKQQKKEGDDETIRSKDR